MPAEEEANNLGMLTVNNEDPLSILVAVAALQSADDKHKTPKRKSNKSPSSGKNRSSVSAQYPGFSTASQTMPTSTAQASRLSGHGFVAQDAFNLTPVSAYQTISSPATVKDAVESRRPENASQEDQYRAAIIQAIWYKYSNAEAGTSTPSITRDGYDSGKRTG